MLIASRRLIYDLDFFSADLRSGDDVEICEKWVHENFHLPKDTRCIYFEIYDKSAKDRFSFSISNEHPHGLEHASFFSVVYSHENKRRRRRIPSCWTLREWFLSILKFDKIYYAGIQYEIK